MSNIAEKQKNEVSAIVEDKVLHLHLAVKNIDASVNEGRKRKTKDVLLYQQEITHLLLTCVQEIEAWTVTPEVLAHPLFLAQMESLVKKVTRLFADQVIPMDVVAEFMNRLDRAYATHTDPKIQAKFYTYLAKNLPTHQPIKIRYSFIGGEDAYQQELTNRRELLHAVISQRIDNFLESADLSKLYQELPTALESFAGSIMPRLDGGQLDIETEDLVEDPEKLKALVKAVLVNGKELRTNPYGVVADAETLLDQVINSPRLIKNEEEDEKKKLYSEKHYRALVNASLPAYDKIVAERRAERVGKEAEKDPSLPS